MTFGTQFFITCTPGQVLFSLNYVLLPRLGLLFHPNEGVHSSETSVTSYRLTWRHIPENSNLRGTRLLHFLISSVDELIPNSLVVEPEGSAKI
jgi:hypothetical protein